VKEANKRGFDIAVISHRGMYGCKLSSPRLYHASSTIDLREPMNDIYQRFCKPYGRKLMAVGCSLGANRLACTLGEDGDECVLDAAVCV
jgi:uncharacterized protein